MTFQAKPHRIQTIADILEVLNPISHSCSPELPINSFSVDSRALSPGDVFVAIPGARVDGHKFVEKALASGAVACLVQNEAIASNHQHCILVPNTIQALGELAFAHQSSLPVNIVAITGSVGKTTTKEMLHQVISPFVNASKTLGNFNSTIGLPMQILRLDQTQEWMVCEMGMSTPGEIRTLMEMTKPKIGLWTSVKAVHLANFQDLEGIAKAKAEMVQGLDPEGTLVFNADDPLVSKYAEKFKGHKVRYSLLNPKADVHGRVELYGSWKQSSFELRFKGSAPVRASIPLPGRFNVSNAIAAAATAYAMGISPGEFSVQFKRIQPAWGRSQLYAFDGNIEIVDDSYNSNPAAMDEVLRSFALLKEEGHRWLICGDMLELGPREVAMHQELGEKLAQYGFSRVTFVGPLSRFAFHAFNGNNPQGQAEHFSDVSSAMQVADASPPNNSKIWIKASRGIHLDRLSKTFIANLEDK